MEKSHQTAISAETVPAVLGTDYPKVYAGNIKDRAKRALGDAFGLTNFGVNLVCLPAGESSSQRHWHKKQDEFIYVLTGELTLIMNDGEETIGSGMVAGFAAGVENGHQMVNRSSHEAVYLEIGDRTCDDVVEYPDIDLRFTSTTNEKTFTHKDATPY